MRFPRRRARPSREPTRRYFSPERELFTGQEFVAYLQAQEARDPYFAYRWY